MTSNQRRPGFRLPWSSEEEAAAAAHGEGNGSAPVEDVEADEATAHEATAHEATAHEDASHAPDAREVAEESELEAPAAAPSSVAAAEHAPEEAAPMEPEAVEPATATEAAPEADTSGDFMRHLVDAMRRVADETREASLAELRTRSEDQVSALQAETDSRAAELRSRSEADIAAVSEWARAEEERIKQEAEGRVAARHAQLDEQLAAETSRAEAATTSLRDRVSDYERDLDAYHAQLSDITDPAAFATAAKRMPPPPDLSAPVATNQPPEAAEEAEDEVTQSAEDEAAEQADEHADAPADAGRAEPTPAEWASIDRAATANGTSPEAAAELEGAAPTPEPESPTVEAPRGDGAATEVLVKGLGSFGAITGFRQALAGVDGIDGVSLSLGPTGEFVFRALHSASFDVAAAIKSIEGDAATIEERSEGGIRVTLERNR